MKSNSINISNKNVAYTCAVHIIAAVFIYSLITLIYVLIRTSHTIFNSLPNGDRTAILWQNGISVIYTISIFSIVMAIISGIISGITAVIVKNLLHYFNAKFNYKKSIFISILTVFIIILIVFSILHIILNDWMTFDNIEPFLFWFLIPASLFLIVTIIGGFKLNKKLMNFNKFLQ